MEQKWDKDGTEREIEALDLMRRSLESLTIARKSKIISLRERFHLWFVCFKLRVGIKRLERELDEQYTPLFALGAIMVTPAALDVCGVT